MSRTTYYRDANSDTLATVTRGAETIAIEISVWDNRHNDYVTALSCRYSGYSERDALAVALNDAGLIPRPILTADSIPDPSA